MPLHARSRQGLATKASREGYTTANYVTTWRRRRKRRTGLQQRNMHGFDFSRQNAAQDSFGQQIPSVQPPPLAACSQRLFGWFLSLSSRLRRTPSRGTLRLTPSPTFNLGITSYDKTLSLSCSGHLRRRLPPGAHGKLPPR